jgi:putative transposase
MARISQPVKLTDNEIHSLTTMLSRGSTSSRTNSRARILKLLHRGQHPAAIATVLQVSKQTVFNVKRRYLTDGLQAALLDQPRSGRPVRIDGKQRAKVTALACSTPPSGHARWTLRLLADKAVELGYCDSLSHTKARSILKKTNSSRI